MHRIPYIPTENDEKNQIYSKIGKLDGFHGNQKVQYAPISHRKRYIYIPNMEHLHQQSNNSEKTAFSTEITLKHF